MKKIVIPNRNHLEEIQRAQSYSIFKKETYPLAVRLTKEKLMDSAKKRNVRNTFLPYQASLDVSLTEEKLQEMRQWYLELSDAPPADMQKLPPCTNEEFEKRLSVMSFNPSSRNLVKPKKFNNTSYMEKINSFTRDNYLTRRASCSTQKKGYNLSMLQNYNNGAIHTVEDGLLRLKQKLNNLNIVMDELLPTIKNNTVKSWRAKHEVFPTRNSILDQYISNSLHKCLEQSAEKEKVKKIPQIMQKIKERFNIRTLLYTKPKESLLKTTKMVIKCRKKQMEPEVKKMTMHYKHQLFIL